LQKHGNRLVPGEPVPPVGGFNGITDFQLTERSFSPFLFDGTILLKREKPVKYPVDKKWIFSEKSACAKSRNA
jgi:hypothetical protein